MLDQCKPTSQWLYERLEPILEDSPHYGYLELFDYEVAKRLGQSPATITCALHDLREHGVMRRSFEGYWYAPHIIAGLVKRCVR